VAVPAVSRLTCRSLPWSENNESPDP